MFSGVHIVCEFCGLLGYRYDLFVIRLDNGENKRSWFDFNSCVGSSGGGKTLRACYELDVNVDIYYIILYNGQVSRDRLGFTNPNNLSYNNCVIFSWPFSKFTCIFLLGKGRKGL